MEEYGESMGIEAWNRAKDVVETSGIPFGHQLIFGDFTDLTLNMYRAGVSWKMDLGFGQKSTEIGDVSPKMAIEFRDCPITLNKPISGAKNRISSSDQTWQW